MCEDSDLIELSTVEAIKYIKDYFGVESNYKIAKMLSNNKLTVQPIQITHYIKGRQMYKKTAQLFLDTFGIVITDINVPKGRPKSETLSSSNRPSK